MSWRTEKKEHPWASTATAKRIAKDHHTKKKPRCKVVPQKGGSPLIQARKDFTGLYGGAKRIANQPKP